MMMVLALLSWIRPQFINVLTFLDVKLGFKWILRKERHEHWFEQVYELKKINYMMIWVGNGHYTWSYLLELQITNIA